MGGNLPKADLAKVRYGWEADLETAPPSPAGPFTPQVRLVRRWDDDAG